MKTTGCILAMAICAATAAWAQVIDTSDTRVQTTLDPGLKRVGTLRPKGASEIETSRWTLGCETIDREYADYDRYKEYLAPLGIRRIRLQGGWARTEKDPGIYDFAWLDHIIDDARARGLEIWLETSYGNPGYPGGGGRTLSGGFPSSAEGLAAWDAWVERMATRYRGKVRDWSMWNEPDGNKAHTAEAITEFNIRTAEIIKRVIPDARIAGLVLCRPRAEIIEHFVRTLAERGKLGLFHWVVYHAYARNPDDMSADVVKAREIVGRHAPGMRLWQGESGAQSEYCVSGAMSKYPWTELTQAKWDTRRMLGDIGHGSDSAVFTAADIEYRTTSFHNGLVRYGLIKTAGAVDGFRVLKVKIAYYAVQNVVSVFNDALEPMEEGRCEARCERPVAAFGYRDRASGRPVVAFWDRSAVPTDANDVRPATLSVRGARFVDPVWVDSITGGVWEIPGDQVTSADGGTEFRELPVYDAPAFVADRALLSIVEPAGAPHK